MGEMIVVIIRHGRVDHTWKRNCTSDEFDMECAEYDIADVINENYEIPMLEKENVYISTLSRSRDTAVRLFGNRDMIATELLDEVPLRSSMDVSFRLPLWFWNFTGRLQWIINSSRQKEGRAATRHRAEEFIDIICANDVDSVVVTHGFFMHTLLKEMKRAGFLIDRSHIHFSNGEYIIARKNREQK